MTTMINTMSCYVDWQTVQLQSAAELVSRMSGAHPDWCHVQTVSTVELTCTCNSDAVASTSLTAPVTPTRRTTRRTGTDRQSTVSRNQTSLMQSPERRRRLYCSLCRVKLNADQQAEQHYRGKLHTRKSKMMTLMSTTSETNATRCLTVNTQVGLLSRSSACSNIISTDQPISRAKM